MARYTGPKNRLARREGVDLGLKTIGSKAHASLLRRLTITPGQHGAKHKRAGSGYSVQLREKQKARRMYGILEKQFRRYFDEAMQNRGNTGATLLTFLELRLDNVVYRANLAPTRAAARQFVGHGHVLVNGKRVSIPSYRIQVNDVISFTPVGVEIPSVVKLLKEKNSLVPTWIERQGAVGKVLRIPGRDDIDLAINEQLIVEYYSR